jgi:hypothetical protein
MAKQLYDIRNYPRNAGTSQPGRNNAALMGEKVSIIEHNIADYIVFAHKLSVYLKYYNDKNEEAGNWQNFLVNDVSFHLAIIVADKPAYCEDTWHELMERVEGAADNEKNKKYFTWRFDFLYTLMNRLTDAFIYSKQLLPWQNELKALYTTANLNIIYDLLEKYSKASKDLFTDDAGVFSYKDMTLNKRQAIVTNIETNKEILSGILSTDGLLVDDGKFIFGDSTKVIDKINAATEYLDDLAQQLLRIYARVHDIAETHLELSLTNFDEHQPHIGLFYAFLQLLDEHKTEINSLLLKHLDYYYRQVLKVKVKPYQPSKAYVTFEPAKNVSEYFLKTGTLLSAGKDAKGKDIFYKTQQDIIVNRAELGEIKSFTVIRNEGEQQNERVRAGEPLGIFACPQANSSDGNGKPLQPAESWNAFRATSNEANTDTKIGISLYSALILEAPPVENKFQILIKFKSVAGLSNLKNFVDSYCTLKILTDKEPLISQLSKVVFAGNQLSFEFIIPEKTKIKKAAPNVSILFGRKAQGINNEFFTTMESLQSADIETFSIMLMAQTIPVNKAETVLGMTDLSASFPAFGGVPKNGSWFKIIEPILKGKAVSELKAEIEWASKTERPFEGTITYNKHPDNTVVPVNYFVHNDQAISLLDIVTPGNTPPIFSKDYIKVILKSDNDLGHKTFAADVAAAVSDDYKEVIPELMYAYIKMPMEAESSSAQQTAVMKKNFPEDMAERIGHFQNRLNPKKSFPKPPYTPVIKSINLICTLTETIAITNLFYQYPHGYKEIDTGKLFLIPVTSFEGELYIGFKNLAQAQSLNVLIQVEEGTADPTLPNPEVSWTFLHNNSWQNFDSSQFKDGTKGLIQSGIVSFVSPGFDCTNNTLLPAGQFWMRAGIRFNETNAVCKIFCVNTQAVLVQFSDNNNDAASLGSNLPASTITQLFPKQASIKKVQQPYATFGGRLEEENKNLYTRTSERLRHKNRAITAWDYEHIIAETFPEIYKVKVLTHASLKTKADKKIIVSKAGQMIILVVGKTAAQSSLYKPLVSKSKLTEITEFIIQLNSPFANVDVINPLFEEVSVDTIVTFQAAVKDEAFYEKKLQTDIKRFLSPWAFEDGTEPEFGGIIYRAALLDFIEELPYIDFVEKLEISHQNSVSGDIAAASSPASVLISAQTHKVDGKLKTTTQSNINLLSNATSLAR